jgi:hypothetical protein
MSSETVPATGSAPVSLQWSPSGLHDTAAVLSASAELLAAAVHSLARSCAYQDRDANPASGPGAPLLSRSNAVPSFIANPSTQPAGWRARGRGQ